MLNPVLMEQHAEMTKLIYLYTTAIARTVTLERIVKVTFNSLQHHLNVYILYMYVTRLVYNFIY